MKRGTILYFLIIIVMAALALSNAAGPIVGGKIDIEVEKPVVNAVLEVPPTMAPQEFLKLNRYPMTLEDAILTEGRSGKVSAFGVENATLESEDTKTGKKTMTFTARSQLKNDKKATIVLTCDREVCTYKVTKVEKLKEVKT